MQTTVNIDVGMILAALAPTLAIVVTAGVAARARRAIADKSGREIAAVHVLVNDQLTREKASRLAVLKTQKVLMQRLELSPEERPLLDALTQQIAQLEVEIKSRDAVAVSVAAAKREAP